MSNLATSIARMDPFADAYHLDVSDAHFAPSLLFFPDLLKALRPLTRRPFHVHLMVDRPTTLIEEFVAAGADMITIHAEVDETEAFTAIEAIRLAGRSPGLALRLETAVAIALPFLDRIDSLLLLGTADRRQGAEPGAGSVRPARERGVSVGRAPPGRPADRRWRNPNQTVPLLRQAGADVVVPGSLVFPVAGSCPATIGWLRSL